MLFDAEDVVPRAEALARIAHAGRYNERSLEPEINHPTRVAGRAQRTLGELRREGVIDIALSIETLQVVVAIGWLHDTIEDTWLQESVLDVVFPWGGGDLVDSAMNRQIADGVRLLSKNWEPYARPVAGKPLTEWYYPRIKEHPAALVAKTSDIKDNGDPIRLAKIEDRNDRDRLVRKYDTAAEALGVGETFDRWKAERRMLPEWDLLPAGMRF